MPCAIVSPCHIPYDAPRNVVRDIKLGYPRFVRRRSGALGVGFIRHGKVGTLAATELGLDDVPFLERPMKTQLIYAIPPSIYPIPGYLPDTVRATGFIFPPEGWEREVIAPTRCKTSSRALSCASHCRLVGIRWERLETMKTPPVSYEHATAP